MAETDVDETEELLEDAEDQHCHLHKPLEEMTLSERRAFRRKKAFLREFAKTGVMKPALEAVGISRSLVNTHWLQTDPWFKVKFREAEEAAADVIEQEMVRRAVHGYDEPVVHQGMPTMLEDPETGERRMFTIKRYDSTLLKSLIMARRPDKFRERANVEVKAGQGGGVLVVPGISSTEDWEREVAKHQAKFRGNEGEDGSGQ